MAVCTVRFKGKSIGKDTAMTVLLPDGDGPFPVLYLLHGLSDDHTAWHRRTGIELYAPKLPPLILVMPDGHRSFYCNDPHPGGLRYEDHIVRDVVEFTDHAFRTIPSRRGRAIAGLSMGGYGAFMLAMRHPDVFCAACSHSGAMFFAHKPLVKRPEVNAYARALDRQAYDCHLLADRLKRSRRSLALRLDCGTEDGLLESNRQFHARLDSLGIAHEYAEYPGAHNWAYWDEHVVRTLAFVLKHVRHAP